MEGSKDTKGAIATIDKLTGPDWYAIFKELHAGLILDAAGKSKEAGKRFEAAYKLDSSALRVMQAYGGWVSRNKSPKEALELFETFDKAVPRHPLVVADMEKLKAGQKLPLLVNNPQAGAAFALTLASERSRPGRLMRGATGRRRARAGRPGWHCAGTPFPPGAD